MRPDERLTRRTPLTLHELRIRRADDPDAEALRLLVIEHEQEAERTAHSLAGRDAVRRVARRTRDWLDPDRRDADMRRLLARTRRHTA